MKWTFSKQALCEEMGFLVDASITEGEGSYFVRNGAYL